MNLGDPLTKDSLLIGTLWILQVNVNGYQSSFGQELSTQAATGRCFQLISLGRSDQEFPKGINRVKVRLLEDNYICWFELSSIIGNAFLKDNWKPKTLNHLQIQTKIPKILSWIKDVSRFSKKYLWGGTIGPDFDCSGLVQAAYASEGIWIPRDAYQQEKFCMSLPVSDIHSEILLPGDLFFFGSSMKCDHVGIHIANGFYWHSSGLSNGHNGIGIDSLIIDQKSSVGSFYKSKFRSVGRVVSCYEGEDFLAK